MTTGKKKSTWEAIKSMASSMTPNAEAAIATGKVTFNYLKTLGEKDIDFLTSPEAIKAYGLKEVTAEKILKLGKENLEKLAELSGEAKSIEDILAKARVETAKERIKSLGKLVLRTVGVMAAISVISTICVLVGGLTGIALLAVSIAAAMAVEKAMIAEFGAEIEEQAANYDEIQRTVSPFMEVEEPQKGRAKTRDEIRQEIIESISRSPSPTIDNPELRDTPRDRLGRD